MSDRYEGLDLVGLMDLLHEVVVPPAVAWTPQTRGWWVLGGWALAVALVCVGHWLAWRRRNRYRRDAEAELDAISARIDADPGGAAAEIATLLKRTALAAYPRAQVASLTGDQWAGFLGASSQADPVVTGAADELARAAYRPGVDAQALVEPARRWIRAHHA